GSCRRGGGGGEMRGLHCEVRDEVHGGGRWSQQAGHGRGAACVAGASARARVTGVCVGRWGRAASARPEAAAVGAAGGMPRAASWAPERRRIARAELRAAPAAEVWITQSPQRLEVAA